MKPEVKKSIERIMCSMTCERDFCCYKNGFKDFDKCHIVGNFVDCTKISSNCLADCKYKVSFGHGVFCDCPLRLLVVGQQAV